MPIKIPHTYVEEIAEGLLSLIPSGDGRLNLALFDRSVTQFLNDHPEFEIVLEHRSSQSPHGELDNVILRPPS